MNKVNIEDTGYGSTRVTYDSHSVIISASETYPGKYYVWHDVTGLYDDTIPGYLSAQLKALELLGVTD
jgi:hypothetical protein